MKIISCNVNGIRSAYKKGLLDFINKEKPDILCLQEVKANQGDIPNDLLNISGYSLFLNPARKKGYSGVAIFSKETPISVNSKLDLKRFDDEGRILELELSKFILLNLYFPHGGRQKQNLGYKLEVYEKIFKKIQETKNKKIILIGDFNIAHREIDLSRPKENRNNIMFTVEERQQIDKLINLGFIDSYRLLNNEPDNYSWWPYAFHAKQRNMGWRIDYAFIPKILSGNILNVNIYSECNFSDHCPIGLEMKLD